MTSTCFGHLHVHLRECLYVVSLPMWCYAIGVEAVVLRSWYVVLCTVCQLVSKLHQVGTSSLLIYMMHGHTE